MMRRNPDYASEALSSEDVVSRLRARLENVAVERRERFGGRENSVQYVDLWIRPERSQFLRVVDELFAIDFPHFHVISGDDVGENILLNYHFSLFRVAARGGRVGVSVCVLVPKSDLKIPSLYDRIPGIEYSEREMREMLGVEFEGLPMKGFIFLPEDWDENVKPWRRDEEGLSPDMIRDLS
jgi:membrane-bound hydrogenase subunit beta